MYEKSSYIFLSKHIYLIKVFTVRYLAYTSVSRANPSCTWSSFGITNILMKLEEDSRSWNKGTFYTAINQFLELKFFGYVVWCILIRTLRRPYCYIKIKYRSGTFNFTVFQTHGTPGPPVYLTEYWKLSAKKVICQQIVINK